MNMNSIQSSIIALVAGAMVPFASAHATTLEFALTGVFYRNHRAVKIDVKKLNKTLHKKGLKGLPEVVIVDENPMPYGKLLLKRIEAANKVVPHELWFVMDHGYLYQYPEICYRGEAADVPRIIDGMADTFLHNEQGILAMRFGEETDIRSDVFKSEAALKEQYEGGKSEAKTWLNYNTNSSSVLIMSDLGPQGDGTELYATFIKRCR